MRNAIRLSVAAVLLAIMPLARGASIEPDVIRGTSLFEGFGAMTHIGERRFFAWSNEVGRRGDRVAAFVEFNSGTTMRVSADRSTAYSGGWDPGTDQMVFQQVLKGESDLFVWDVGDQRRTPLRALNDGLWQWGPSIDTHRGVTWVVYGVNRFGSPAARWRLMLHDSETGKQVLLDEATNRCGCLFPGTIAYPWVTWAVGEDSTAWRYNIESGERTPILPTDRDEYGVAVTGDGTTYVAQAGDRCGSDSVLYRVEQDGAPFLLARFADGREAANLYVDTTGLHDELYFDRRNCRTGASDILRLRRAELIGDPVGPQRTPTGGAGGAVRRSGASSGARPRTR